MTWLADWLLTAGFAVALFHDLFLVVSWLSRRKGRNVSPVVIPFFGPICVFAGLALGGRPVWLGLIALLGDGTNSLVLRALGDAWSTSRFTRVGSLQGKRDDREIRLMLHRSNRFVLLVTRFRSSGSLDSRISRTGEYSKVGDAYLLTLSANRTLRVEPEGGEYRIVDPAGELQGWRLAP